MELTVIGISAVIAVLVAGLEALHQRQAGRAWARVRDLMSSGTIRWILILTWGITLALCVGIWRLTPTEPMGPLILLGGLWGVVTLSTSPLGRTPQALAVIGACVWTGILPLEDPGSTLRSLAALGLGLGLTGVPAALVMSGSTGLSLVTGVAQGWGLVAASTWGIQLADLMQGETGWYRVLPCGLAALGLVGGTVPLLVVDPVPERSSPEGIYWPRWLGRGIGGTVASLLALVLVRNWLLQGPFYPLAFGIGVGLSLGLMALQEGGFRGRESEPGDPAQALQQGILSLALVGGGALLALRWGGSYGAAVVGLGLLTFPSRWSVTAALFLAARPLVQSLLTEFDLNLSGINITHVYTYAALFLGMAGIGIALLVRWIYGQRWPAVMAVSLTLLSVLTPGLTGYLMHLRPQGAMVLAALMVAVVIGALEPAVVSQWRKQASSSPAPDTEDPFQITWGIQGLLLSLMGILTALVGSDITLAGATATRLERLGVLAGVVIITGVILGLGSVWTRSGMRRSHS